MNTKNNYYFRLAGSLLTVLVILWLGVGVYNNLHFRITGTEPGTDSVSTISPYFRVNFNRNLNTKLLAVAVDPAGATLSESASAKTISIRWNTPLSTSLKYRVTLKGITDIAGHKLPDKVYELSPKDIPFNKLSPAEQNEIKKQQTNKSSSVSVTFGGMASLQAQGVTNAQIYDLETALKQFSPDSKTFAVDTGSVGVVPHNPASASTSSTIKFIVNIGPKSYSAKLEYSKLTIGRLYLTENGVQVFDSGDISSE